MSERCRFAPSTTGEAHPGTLLAALLCWLDARSRRAHVSLRLEDLDTTRCKPEWAEQMPRDLAWLGLDWDETTLQHGASARHEAALDRLASMGLLYPCECSRAQQKATGRQAPDGSWVYTGRCRGRPLPGGGWRASTDALRVRLPDELVVVHDESGLGLNQRPAEVMGDPIVRRRDGVVAYQLAVVVDDGAQGITRIVRGRDIAPSTATQVALQRLLGLPTPTYRHHLLLLEPRGDKLAKLHGSVGARALRAAYDGPALCGWLAWVAGLRPAPDPCAAADLLDDFDWTRVRREDVTVRWDGHALMA